MRIQAISAVVLFTAAVAAADATIDQKTQFHFSGALGTMINVFSRGTRDGVTSSEIVKGNRKLRRTESSGELVDLDEEKVYTIDFGRQSYSVKTFADLRREWEEQQARAKKNAERQEREERGSGIPGRLRCPVHREQGSNQWLEHARGSGHDHRA